MLRLLVLVVALALTGCATTNPYATFASAGVTHAQNLDAVLAAAERTGVDATSWRLLDADLLDNATVEQYATYLAEILVDGIGAEASSDPDPSPPPGGAP